MKGKKRYLKRSNRFIAIFGFLSARTLLVDKIERSDFCFSRVFFEVRCHSIGAEKKREGWDKKIKFKMSGNIVPALKCLWSNKFKLDFLKIQTCSLCCDLLISQKSICFTP